MCVCVCVKYIHLLASPEAQKHKDTLLSCKLYAFCRETPESVGTSTL